MNILITQRSTEKYTADLCVCVVTFRIKQILIVYICFRFFPFALKKERFRYRNFLIPSSPR